MRLLSVYGLKTGDYGYLSRFYPAQRLIEECENRSMPLRFLFPRDVSAFLGKRTGIEGGSADLPLKDENIPSITDFPPDETICLIRGRVDPATIRELEEAGYRCVNPSAAIALANDKVETARFLSSLGIPTPRTARVEERECAFKESDYPLVAKPRYGSRGEGVMLVENPEAAIALSGEAERNRLPGSGDCKYIFQEFIAASRGRDLRAFFTGSDIIAIVERRSSDGSLVSNACSGGTMIEPESGATLSEPWDAMVRRIARESGLWYGTVDFLYATDSGGTLSELDLTVCELNAAPGFEALERYTKKNIARVLVDALIRDFW